MCVRNRSGYLLTLGRLSKHVHHHFPGLSLCRKVFDGSAAPPDGSRTTAPVAPARCTRERIPLTIKGIRSENTREGRVWAPGSGRTGHRLVAGTVGLEF